MRNRGDEIGQLPQGDLETKCTHIANPRPRPGIIRLFPVGQARKCLDHLDTLPVVNERPVGKIMCDGQTCPVELGLEEFAARHHQDREKEWGVCANVGYIVQSVIEQVDERIEFCQHSIMESMGKFVPSVIRSSTKNQNCIRTVPRARPPSAHPRYQPR